MRSCVGDAGALSPVPAAVSPGLGVACPGVLLTPHMLDGASAVPCQRFSQDLASNDS